MTQYYLFFFSLFAGFGLATIFSLHFPKLLKILVGIIIFALTIPSLFPRLADFSETVSTGQSLSTPYFQTFTYLAKQGTYNDMVLELPPFKASVTASDILEWYNLSSTDITAFANKQTYFNSEFIDFPNLPIPKRIAFVQEIMLRSKDGSVPSSHQKMMQLLTTNHIKYIYVTTPYPQLDSMKGLTKIYKNTPFAIYKID